MTTTTPHTTSTATATAGAPPAATATATATAAATSRRRRSRLAAVGTAAAATSATYLVARALGTDFALTDPGGTKAHALVLPEIAAFTLLFGLLGWGALALLERATRRARTVWTALAVAVLALSFVPVAVETATADTKAALVLVHLVVAAVLVPAMRRGAGPVRT